MRRGQRKNEKGSEDEPVEGSCLSMPRKPNEARFPNTPDMVVRGAENRRKLSACSRRERGRRQQHHSRDKTKAHVHSDDGTAIATGHDAVCGVQEAGCQWMMQTARGTKTARDIEADSG